ncbi:MAG: dihydrofolate reductase [Oscillospiraceae bacterium]|nr:dihydrofolate reductase [Oscillospiraceae bacterium]
MITIIAAVGKNKELGKNNDLIWHLPSDLEFFKKQTKGSIVAMGRNTFDSLPFLLPSRKHIILSLNNKFNKDIGDSLVFNNIDEFISYCKKMGQESTVFIIGGVSIYKVFIDIADELILTEIHAEDKEADVYFPEFKKQEYTVEVLGTGQDNGIKFTHKRYLKRISK